MSMAELVLDVSTLTNSHILVSLSYLLGDVFSRVYLGSILNSGITWQHLFLVSFVTALPIAIVTSVFLRQSPEDHGFAV